MPSFKFIVRPERSNKVSLRITCDRKLAELSVGISLTREELDYLLSDEPTPHSRIREKNTLMFYQKVVDDIKADSPKHISAAEFKHKIEREVMVRRGLIESKGDFIPFFKKSMESVTNKGYKATYEYTLDNIQEWKENYEALSFKDITVSWLNEFDEWLRAKKKLSQNTRCIIIKNIRTVINRAIDEELTTNYPFRRFKIRSEETPKRDLPVEELRRLFNYPVDNFQKYYLDYFKLIFLLIGINGTDLYNLTRIDNGRIAYRRAKTHKLYSIKVEPEAMEIIKRHRAKNGDGLLDITDRWKRPNDFLKWCNISLKKIGAEKCKGGRLKGGAPNKVNKDDEPKGLWPEISTYWARHSWASIAYNDCGVSKDVISQALGHDMGARVTEIYLHKNQKLIDEANRRVIDWVLYGKR